LARNPAAAQELIRFNALIDSVSSSLSSLRKALKGLVLLSVDLEEVGNSLRNGKVARCGAIWIVMPQSWVGVQHARGSCWAGRKLAAFLENNCYNYNVRYNWL
jgi:hypothetical protein